MDRGHRPAAGGSLRCASCSADSSGAARRTTHHGQERPVRPQLPGPGHGAHARSRAARWLGDRVGRTHRAPTRGHPRRGLAWNGADRLRDGAPMLGQRPLRVRRNPGDAVGPGRSGQRPLRGRAAVGDPRPLRRRGRRSSQIRDSRGPASARRSRETGFRAQPARGRRSGQKLHRPHPQRRATPGGAWWPCPPGHSRLLRHDAGEVAHAAAFRDGRVGELLPRDRVSRSIRSSSSQDRSSGSRWRTAGRPGPSAS